MAAPKVEISDSNETKEETDTQMQNITIPEPEQSVLAKVTKEMAELYKYKCKHQINNDGSCTFYPTPNCKPSSERLESKSMSSVIDTILDKANCKSAAAYSTNTAIYITAEHELDDDDEDDDDYEDEDEDEDNEDDEDEDGDEDNEDEDAYDLYKYEDYFFPQILDSRGRNSFIVSSLTAWSQHYPFRFRPEHIWLLILQSVAVHVDQNAEKLRDKYVTHDDKPTLKIEVSANSDEEWITVIEGFVQQIDKNTIEDTCALLDCDFSRSTLTEKIATKVTIMDICKNFFYYLCYTRCGFPQITLDGTQKDWMQLKQKVSTLLRDKVDKKFGAQWSESLLPLLDRFIVAFDGNIDCLFWNSMIKRGSAEGSGGYSWFSGWFNILFPFINKESEWNRFCEPYTMDKSYVAQGLNDYGSGFGPNDQDSYPDGLASVPVIWSYCGTKIPLKFIAGFIGYKQDKKTLEITPNIGWCVAYAMNDKEIEEKPPTSRYRYDR